MSEYSQASRQPRLLTTNHRGMKEDINLHGNELNYMTAVFWTSYCNTGLLGLTRTPINIALPTLEIGWDSSRSAVLGRRMQNPNTIYAMRFFIGICESCSFTGVKYVIGSWYKPGEVTRRVALFLCRFSTWDYVRGLLAGCCFYEFEGKHGLPGTYLTPIMYEGLCPWH
ncbi:unnamed protein product [Penicillium egyptiacum]|uniref:Uncharacterized protein n=1 Tax=Penicillium egyptiacum TaxID=1303716 RepID=A0A9W4KH77_9EURO|nr:unnamed protein product [Penicillium egyptiacum]